MTNPAEKIQQVVEEGKLLLNISATRPLFKYGEETQYVRLDLAEKDMQFALAAQLDSFIQWHEMKAETVYQDYPNEAGHIQHGRIAAHVKSARELKEARTSLTNSTHE